MLVGVYCKLSLFNAHLTILFLHTIYRTVDRLCLHQLHTFHPSPVSSPWQLIKPIVNYTEMCILHDFSASIQLKTASLAISESES